MRVTLFHFVKLAFWGTEECLKNAVDCLCCFTGVSVNHIDVSLKQLMKHNMRHKYYRLIKFQLKNNQIKLFLQVGTILAYVYCDDQKNLTCLHNYYIYPWED